MKNQVIILKASRYRMTDEQTGEIVEGTKVVYCQDLNNNIRQNSKGVDIVNGTMSYAAYDGLREVPGYYDMEFGVKANAKGQAVLVPEKAVFVKPL